MSKPPYPPNVVRAGIDYRSKEFLSMQKPPQISKGYIGAITSIIEKAFISQSLLERRNENETPHDRATRFRHLVYGLLFGDPANCVDPIVTSDLRPEHIYALYMWVKPVKSGETWISGRTNEKWGVELAWVLTEALFSHTHKKPISNVLAQVADQMREGGEDALQYDVIVDAIKNLGAQLVMPPGPEEIEDA